MKKIIIVRHAKSSFKYNVIDHERPLNNRGYDDAHLLSKHLGNKKLNIDLVLSSDATRAKNTANIFISNLKINENLFILDHDLYDFSGENLTRKIKACNDSINDLMVFGHNHAITAFVNAYGDKYIENVPTCGIVIMEFDIKHWKDLNKGETIETLFPKDLKS